MYVIIVLSEIISKVICYQCCQCHCIYWMDTLICSGQNITHFPDLNDSSWVSHLDILDTNITQIPSFAVAQWG